jgi:predicted membrane-bound mannosyltransferase
VFRAWDIRGNGFFKTLRFGPLLAGVSTFLALIVVLFTWFGRNWKSLFALSHVAPNVLARAAGRGHEQPFWYFGKLLISGWSGGLLVGFAGLGLFIALRKRDISAYRLLAYYGLLVVAIYSMIPYKTPWLALNFWLPLALFAAVAAESVWFVASTHFGQSAAIFSCCTLAFFSGVLIAHDTRLRVFRGPADESNPYAYAQTSDDILELPREIADTARRDGISTPRIAVIASDPWPLPWYLRRFQQVGFWQPGQQVTDADFYVTSTEAADQYADRLHDFRPDFFGSRPGVLILLWLPARK